MSRYLIADCPFDICFTEGREDFEQFRRETDEAEIPVIKVCDFDDVSTAFYGVRSVDGEYDRIFKCRNNPLSLLLADKEWTDFVICKDGGYSDELMLTAVYSNLCKKNSLLAHASFVDYKGEGLVFVGPSGVGKTTQARLWNECLDAEIINGDKVIIRVVDNGVYAYGSPWKGSSPYCVNKKSPLKGIVLLMQDTENSITKVEKSDEVQLLLPHIFMPCWDEELVSRVLTTFDKILKSTSVWLLKCKPDYDAVRLTEQTIFNKI